MAILDFFQSKRGSGNRSLMGESKGGREEEGVCNQNQVKISTLRKVGEEGWSRPGWGGGLQLGGLGAGRGAQGGHPGADGFGVILGSRSGRPLGIRNPSCCGQAESEGSLGSQTPSRPRGNRQTANLFNK